MGEELYRNTLVTVNQLISKGQKDHQIWGVNDGVMLQTKDMQINHLQTIKQSKPGINNNIVIAIDPAENCAKNKNKKGKIWQMISPNY